MKLGKLVEKEELKDYLFLMVKQSKKNKLVFYENIVAPASEILTLILSLYNKKVCTKITTTSMMNTICHICFCRLVLANL